MGDSRPTLGALSQLDDLDFEIIYVDDGSRDATPDMLREIQAVDPHAGIIRFSRNFGHQTAVTAGLEHASGDAVVLIDADLQDPPEVIAEMVARWREGYHVAYGVRTDREGETRFKLATAKAFYRLLNRMSETRIPLDTGDFRLMDRRVVDVLRAMPERDRFVRGMVAWAGFRQIAVPYTPGAPGSPARASIRCSRWCASRSTASRRSRARRCDWRRGWASPSRAWRSWPSSTRS